MVTLSSSASASTLLYRATASSSRGSWILAKETRRGTLPPAWDAVTDESVQLMGVWTHPRYRRRGLSRELLTEVCGHLARRRKTTTLFVNYFNTPALALYESLGFERIGMNRALIW